MYLNLNAPSNYQLQGFGQNGVRTISTDQLYIQGEYYRVLVAEEDSYVTAVSVLGDDLTAEFVYAGTTIYGLFTEVSVSSGSLTAYIAGPTDIEDVWAYINAYGEANAARIEAADCAKDAIAPLLDKYYAKASLVMVPSLYKTSIVYSERPLTTAGQLAFTRSNDTATRVGPDGYIEKVRTNLLLQSEAFDNAVWSKTNVNVRQGSGIVADVTANYTTSPIGTLTADRVVLDLDGGTTSSDRSGLIQIIPTTSGITMSVYLKSNTSSCTVRLFSTATAQMIANVTTDWQRFVLPFDAAATIQLRVYLEGGATSDFADLSVWGAQAETGDIATDYIPTTTAAVSVGPLANLPRLNYPINSDGSVGCPSLLLEPQRQNLVTFSESFDNAAWNKTNVTIAANDEVSPDGYTNADKITDNANNTQHRVTQTISVTSGTSYTASIFVKNDDKGDFAINFTASGFASTQIVFNLINGTVTSGTGTIQDYGNGWYRISATAAANVTGSGTIGFNLGNGGSYVGSEQSVFIYGAQIEAGAYATSYIPTLGSASTRGSDAASKSGISSLLGATEGVVFLEVGDIQNNSATGAEVWYFEMRKDQNNSFGLASGGSAPQPIRFVTKIAGTAVTETEPAPFANSKIAIKYTSTQFKLFRNGTLLYTTNKSIGDYADIEFMEGAGVNLSMVFNQFLVFPTALSDAEAIALTTL
jgi:hypothetical protein